MQEDKQESVLGRVLGEIFRESWMGKEERERERERGGCLVVDKK
jgi:hypothetical protein